MLFLTKETSQRTYVGKGFALEDKRKENLLDIYQDDDNRPNHTFVFGSTGVGKTRLLEEQDLMFISTIFPKYSLKINPLNNYFIDEEIISNIISGVPAKDEFFLKVAQETTTAIVKSLVLLRKINGNDEPITFEEVAKKAHYRGIESLKDELDSIESCNEDTDLNADLIRIKSLLEQVMSSNQDYFSKVTTTLRTTLSEMSVGNIGKIIGNVKTNKFIDRLEEDKPVLLYVMTGSMVTRESSSILAKIVVSMIQCCVGRVISSGKSFTHRLNIYIDESASVLYRGIETLYAQGRSSNINLTGLTQSKADLIAAIGDDAADRILDLTNTKIIMRINEQKSAKMISDMAGKRMGYSVFLNLDGGLNSREVEEMNIETDDITQLQKREFFYFGFEGRFKGKTAPVSNCKLQIIFPDISTKEARKNR